MNQVPTITTRKARFIHEDGTTLDCSNIGNYLVLAGSDEPLPIFSDADLHHYLDQEAISVASGWQRWTIHCRSCGTLIDPNEYVCLKCKIEAFATRIVRVFVKEKEAE